MPSSPLADFEKLLSSVLIAEQAAHREGITANRVRWLYKEIVDEDLPVQKLGCSSVPELLAKVPNTIEIVRRNGEVLYKVKPPEDAGHVAKLVNKQRAAKKKGQRPGKPAPHRYNKPFAPLRYRSFRPSLPPTKPQRPPHLRPPRMQPLQPSMRPPMRPNRAPMHPNQPPIYPNQPSMYSNQPLIRPNQLPVPPSQPARRAPPTPPVREPQQLEPATQEPQQRPSTSSFWNKRGRANIFQRALWDVAHQDTPPRRVSGKDSVQVTISNRPPVSNRLNNLPPRLRQAQERNQGRRSHVSFAQPRENSQETSSAFNPATRGVDAEPDRQVNILTTWSSTGATAHEPAGRLDSEATPVSPISEPSLPPPPSSESLVLSPHSSASDTQPSLSAAADTIAKVKRNIKTMLDENPNGLLLNSLHILYKKRFGHEPELDLIEVVPTWKSVCEVDETVISSDQVMRIVYPPVVRPNTVRPSAMDLGQSYSVYLSNTDSLNELFLQFAETTISDFNTQLNFYFTVNEGKMLVKPKVGAFCIAPFTMQVFRAVIMQLQGEDCLVFFLDFGNKVWVTKQDIWEIPKEFIDFPAQAIPCVLDGVYPMNDQQLETASKYFGQLLDYENEELRCEVVNFQNKKYRVKLFHNSLQKSLNAVLVDGSHTMPFPICPAPMSASLPDDVASFPVFVCYVSNSAHVVVNLRLDDYLTRLGELQQQQGIIARETAYEGEIYVDEVYVGSVQESPTESRFYRIKILNIDGDQVTAFLLDYCDTVQLCKSDVYPIPAEFMDFPLQAIQVTLTGLETLEENASIESQLCDNILGKDLDATVDLWGDDETLTKITLWSGGGDVNLNQLVLNSLWAAEDVCPRLLAAPSADLSQGFIAHVSSEGILYLHIIGPSSNALGRINQLMQDLVEGEPHLQPVGTPQTDQIYMYLQDDAEPPTYRRIKVLSVKRKSLTVELIDFGIVLNISRSTHLYLSDDPRIVNTPRLALKCSLWNLPPPGFTWTMHAAEAFISRAGTEQLTFEPMGDGINGEPVVNILYFNENREMMSMNEEFRENFTNLFCCLTQSTETELSGDIETSVVSSAGSVHSDLEESAQVADSLAALELSTPETESYETSPREDMSPASDSPQEEMSQSSDSPLQEMSHAAESSQMESVIGQLAPLHVSTTNGLNGFAGLDDAQNGSMDLTPTTIADRRPLPSVSSEDFDQMEENEADDFQIAMAPLPTEGEEVFVTWCASPGNFLCIRSLIRKEFERFKVDMTYELSENPVKVEFEELYEGFVCAIYLRQNYWRVRVQQIMAGQKAILYMLDEGQCLTSHVSFLYQLTPALRKIPQFTFRAKIKGIKPMEQPFCPQAEMLFDIFTRETPMQVRGINFTGAEPVPLDLEHPKYGLISENLISNAACRVAREDN